MTTCHAKSHRLEIVPGGGPLIAQRVLRGPGAEPGPHALAVWTHGRWVPAAVEVIVAPEVPADVVALSEDLAAELGLLAGDVPDWRLDRMDPVPVRRITLELPTERDPREVAWDLARGGLVGRLLWVPPAGTDDVRLAVDDVPYRVRAMDTDGRVGVPGRLTERTQVELYAPAARAGVDIAILADTSGSMQIDDLPVTGERPRAVGQQGWITRIEALREALLDLLAMRLQVSGRVSHVALMQFDEQVKQRFPRAGGMAQLDGGSSPAVVEEFRTAVAWLMPTQSGTLIGNALHEAANLLYQHGKTGNEKLIVLVSDGADWRPTGEQGTGEVVYAHQEPVSLMHHLHDAMGIRLHAIGISTAELFHRRGRWQPHPSVVPDHALLEELVKVGGGDPTTVGGLDVLESYFADLGSGIVHRVTESLTGLPESTGALDDVTREALRRLAVPGHEHDGRRQELHAVLSDAVGTCGDQAVRALGRSLWKPGSWSRTLTERCGVTVAGDTELARFLTGLVRAFAIDSAHLPDVPLTGLDAWRTLLADLDAAVSGSQVDMNRLSTTCGMSLHSAAAAQVTVMGMFAEIVADLETELRSLPAVGDRDDEDRATTDIGVGTSGFALRYRD